MSTDKLDYGTVIAERYSVGELIASGGMAHVYSAFDSRLERKVAIKVIRGQLATDQAFVDKFIAEAKLAAQINHPNLVNIYDQGTYRGAAFMVMELVEGVTLRKVLDDFGSLTPSRALDVTAAVLGALSAAHAAGIIHRDVKPENVLLSNSGKVKLSDFGLARPTSNSTETGDLIGTVAYIAPELVKGERVDVRSDIYSTGVMLFELLTGTQPFTGTESIQVAYQHANDRVAAPSGRKQGLPVAVDKLVLRATEPEPANRFASASAMLTELRNVAVSIRQGQAPTTNATEVIANPTEVISNLTEVIQQEELAALEQEPVALSRKKFVPWLALTAAAMLLGGFAGWWFGSGPGALRVIPELTGRSYEQAAAAITPLGLEIEKAFDFSNTVAEGSVIRTEPGTGGLIISGGTVRVVLSQGERKNAVPNLIGKNIAEATALLYGAGFSVGETTSWFDSSPALTVYDYTGADGTAQPEGAKIDVKVSLGAIPAIVNLDLPTATTLLTPVGLTIDKTSDAYSDTVAKGKIISFSPQGERVGNGGKIDVVLSKGTDKVTMPKVVGETISAADSLLRSLGLTVRIDTNALTKNWGVAKVKSVSVAPGTMLRIGDSVTIVSR